MLNANRHSANSTSTRYSNLGRSVSAFEIGRNRAFRSSRLDEIWHVSHMHYHFLSYVQSTGCSLASRGLFRVCRVSLDGMGDTT